MINQVILRRISHLEEDILGDLLIIDGGKSQLNAAVAALKDLAPENRPPVICNYYRELGLNTSLALQSCK